MLNLDFLTKPIDLWGFVGNCGFFWVALLVVIWYTLVNGDIFFDEVLKINDLHQL